MLIQRRWLSDNEPIYMHHGEAILTPGKRDLSTFIHSWHFFSCLLWKCIMVKLSLFPEKTHTCQRVTPGEPHYLRHAETLFTKKSSLQWMPAVCSILIHCCTDFMTEAAVYLEGFPLYFSPLVTKPRSSCSNTRADNHGGHRALSWLSLGSTLELDSTTWSESTHIPQQFCVSVCLTSVRVASQNRILLERHWWKMLNLLNPRCDFTSHSV